MADRNGREKEDDPSMGNAEVIDGKTSFDTDVSINMDSPSSQSRIIVGITISTVISLQLRIQKQQLKDGMNAFGLSPGRRSPLRLLSTAPINI